ncbi:Juvenile hormone acid O-methyltransferase [Frankliniella fusca]|uniref:Juvenile hormone acid O-methyltransferase n=1 Tax=Frankliniella fusca TaxID=407009 RepID=A0AAE1H4X8_9NEOP|nr:Juvenile hormone acid O-methyltransferase [Frankliniella fusca]
MTVHFSRYTGKRGRSSAQPCPAHGNDMHNADLYESASQLQRRDAEEALDELVPRMSWGVGEWVCDQGSGDGYVTERMLAARLPRDFAQIVGMDKSVEMVRYAAQHHQSDERINFVQQDVEDAATVGPRWRGRFSKVFSFMCWHWVQDQSRVSNTTFEMLAPGGEFGLVCLARSPIYDMFRDMSRSAKWSKYMQDVHNFISPYHDSDRPDIAITKYLDGAGLQVIFCSCREKTYTYKSLDALRESITAVNPFLSRIPAEQREEYIGDCMRKVHELRLIHNNNNDKDDGVSHTYSQLVVHARKPWL